MMTQISILGCGWLGLPLAKALLKNEFSVKGSTTSIEKLSVLENLGIQGFQIELTETKTQGNVDLFVENSQILIIDIPPKLRGDSKENFVSKINNSIPFIERSSIENVLFISSTSVYGDTSSFDCAQDDVLSVTEETKTCPDTESGKQLVQVEQLLQNNPNFKTIILRFGGLIGEDRHPIKFLSGRKNIYNPDAPINLIHQEDCIGIILEIIQHAQHNQLEWTETFNATAPFHPSRREYYTQIAHDLSLDLPEFNDDNSSFGKTISSSKIENFLEYTFKKPNL
jgi:nucleoside-diphosphate-sugar epimerase